MKVAAYLTPLLLLDSTNGFAAWLKCYVDLLDDSEAIMYQPIVKSENAPHTVTIQVQPQQVDVWMNEYSYDGPTVVDAKLLVPDELRGDVQYVMEVVSGDAAFVQPVMCDGKRSHASGRGASVTLRIEGTSEHVELLAGYATGLEAVTLTKTLRLTRSSTGSEL